MTGMKAAVIVKERPILFSASMIKAILSGAKTQTRRIMKPQPPEGHSCRVDYPHSKPMAVYGSFPGQGTATTGLCECPYGKPGDHLWVRETWATDFEANILYRATDENPSPMGPYGAKKIVDGVPSIWRPSIFMPRKASRITLEIVGVRVERLQDITEADAIAEGIQKSGRTGGYLPGNCDYAKWAFEVLWDQINGKHASWASNPWVFVLEFKRVEGKAANPAGI
jgi:hypothetical protein